jgi:hypothetical protein
MRLEHEEEKEYAGKGWAALNTVLGSIGTAGATGILNNLGFGNGATRCPPEEHLVSRYEAAQAARIAELEMEVRLRDANTYTDSKILDLYKYVDGKIDGVNAAICAQNVYNATNSAAIGCIQNQVAQLAALTKTVIPASSICPPVMPLYNSWTAPTTPATTG